MRSLNREQTTTGERKFFYGWIIVAIGFLAHIASAFSISSTLSVFLKPLSNDLGISRGTFSLIRSGEIIISSAAAPLIGSLLDRYGGKWLMAAGGVISGAGFILLGQARDFWQFLLFRWLLVSPGDALMGQMVVNVSISRWFVRMRGRALALAGMGHGLAKVGMPLFAASLIVSLGWRATWAVFGLLTLLLVVGPAFLMRRRPEDMGLQPDGSAGAQVEDTRVSKKAASSSARSSAIADVPWSRAEALRTPAFWLIVTTFGVASVGVTGLNLHVFAFVSDQGHAPMVAAFVMSIIAFMQFSTPMIWGLLAERMEIGRLIMAKFLIQAAGLLWALSEPGGIVSLYGGFFLYGIGMGGTSILSEMIWANYFGRISLGKIRGMGSLLTHVFGAGGPPFFGLLFDATHSYQLSFSIFIAMLFASAFLSLFLRPPKKQRGGELIS